MLKMLPGNIGYTDLSLLPISAVDSMFEMFRNTKAIILDDRGYPQGTAWSIAPRLTDKESVAAASFRRPLVMSPDSTEWTTYEFVQYTPTTTKWRYHGKTVLLVDERTMSQAEHTGLFFEAANKTTIIGSPTVGANGDVTNVILPGGISAWFSGHDVRHADGRQLQRMGLQPDIVVRPTLAGVRAGRDEILERALEFLKK
jgi:C-terminal processing protease CtpA/Prc